MRTIIVGIPAILIADYLYNNILYANASIKCGKGKVITYIYIVFFMSI